MSSENIWLFMINWSVLVTNVDGISHFFLTGNVSRNGDRDNDIRG